MATKTISLELDAYERLKSAKRAGESFSAVVRRAVFPEEPPTGARLLEWYGRRPQTLPETTLDAIQGAADEDPPPDDPWS